MAHCYEKEKLKHMSIVSDGHFREYNLNFNFSNYGDIFSFLNKLKFDNSNICTNLLIREQKIIHNFPFKDIHLNVQIFCAFEVLPENTNLFVSSETYIRNVFINKKTKSSIFLYHVKVFRNNPSAGVLRKMQSWTKHKYTFSGFGLASLNHN